MSNISITYLEKIIHEMNTPLQNLDIIPDLMLDPNVNMSENDKKEGLLHLQSSAKKLIQLVKLLSSITNVSSESIQLNISKVDIIDLINKEIAYHSPNIKRDSTKQLKIALQTQLDECVAEIDSFWFRQLITNLIINAINHTDEGVIRIFLDMQDNGQSNKITIKVVDEGCGIAEDELDEIFEPLTRGSHSVGKVKGSGIGLAVAKEVTEAHGGSIKAENNKTVGATFEVIMPQNHNV